MAGTTFSLGAATTSFDFGHGRLMRLKCIPSLPAQPSSGVVPSIWPAYGIDVDPGNAVYLPFKPLLQSGLAASLSPSGALTRDTSQVASVDLGGSLSAVHIAGTGTLQFFDETGINPLPAGIFVQVYPAGQPQNASTLVGSAWTWPLGFCNVVVQNGGEYVAVFSGSFQAPPQSTASFSVALVNGLQAVTVDNYRSPSLSADGYALEATAVLVKGWFSQGARAPGGIAYAIERAWTEVLGKLDGTQTQVNLGSMRLQSSQNGAVDSWGLDMVGALFQRFPYESDELYISRLNLMVSRPRCTINAIQALVTAFYASIAIESAMLGGGKLGFDIAGAFDNVGAFDTNPPNAPVRPPPPTFVWDKMTEPGLATIFNINEPEFVIEVGVVQASLAQVAAFDLTGGFDTSGAFDIVPNNSVLPTPSSVAPDIRLGLMINLLAKAGGTVPVYIVGN